MTVISTWGGHRPGAGREGVHLKPSEALLIMDAFSGATIDPSTIDYIVPALVEHAISVDRLDTKWHVNGKNLVRRLRRLTHDQAVDLLDKITLFWTTREPTR